jgi:hypothetical protein
LKVPVLEVKHTATMKLPAVVGDGKLPVQDNVPPLELKVPVL